MSGESSTNYMDLSLVKNQNCVAILFSEILSLSLLESIDLNQTEFNNKQYTILEKSDNNCKLTIENRIYKETNKPIRKYFVILLDRSTIFHVELKCICRKRNFIYLNIITAKALNHLNWGDKYVRQIRDKFIMDAFAIEISNLFSKSQLEQFTDFITILSNDECILSNDEFSSEFNTDNIILSVTSFKSELLKFSIFYRDKLYYIFFNRNKIGLSYICLEIEKALIFKK